MATTTSDSLAPAPHLRQLTGVSFMLAACSAATAQVQEDYAWSGPLVEPLSSQVMTTPIVIDLDGDGTPEILFTSYENNG